MGYGSNLLTALSFLKSEQNFSVPSFFGTSMMGLFQSLEEGSMISIFSIVSISCFMIVLISPELCKHNVLVYCLLGKCDVGQGLFYLVFSGIVGEGCFQAIVPSVPHSNVTSPRNSRPAEQVSTAPPLHPPPEPPSPAAPLQHLLLSLAGKLVHATFQHVNVEDLQRLMS